MKRISLVTLRELDALELEVAAAGSVLDTLETLSSVDPDEYAKALDDWSQKIQLLVVHRGAILSTLRGLSYKTTP
jgi:hypothetical protein